MSWMNKHTFLEKNSVALSIGITLVVLVGGIIEIIPLFRQATVIEPVEGVRPYTPLELAGQNIYFREGCYNCHSQQIRPLRDEVARYGHYSLAAESMYDHPFQWGSKRTGPDLARVGGKYSDAWHVAHMKEPTDVVPESIMPSYEFLINRSVNLNNIDRHLKTLSLVGVPYTDDMIKHAQQDAIVQAAGDSADLSGLQERYGDNVNARDFDGQPNVTSEMDAIIAYLQVLGTMVNFDTLNVAEASGVDEEQVESIVGAMEEVQDNQIDVEAPADDFIEEDIEMQPEEAMGEDGEQLVPMEEQPTLNEEASDDVSSDEELSGNDIVETMEEGAALIGAETDSTAADEAGDMVIPSPSVQEESVNNDQQEE